MTVDLNPAAAVHRLAWYAPDTPALVYGERTFTGSEVDGRATRLARYKLPTRVLARESLPRSPSGKLDKLTIRTWVQSAKGDAP